MHRNVKAVKTANPAKSIKKKPFSLVKDIQKIEQPETWDHPIGQGDCFGDGPAFNL